MLLGERSDDFNICSSFGDAYKLHKILEEQHVENGLWTDQAVRVICHPSMKLSYEARDNIAQFSLTTNKINRLFRNTIAETMKNQAAVNNWHRHKSERQEMGSQRLYYKRQRR